MAKFGIFCLPLTSHQNAILPLGAELIRRGHEVTVIGIPDLREKALRAGLAVETIAENEIPAGSMREHAKHSGSSSRFAFLKMAFGSSGFTELMLAYAPAVVRKLSLDFLIVDQSHYEGGSIAESCGIRFATVASDVPQLTDYAVPPLIFGWDYSPDLLGQLRNRAAYAAFHRLSKPVRQKINEFRRQSGLAPHRDFDDLFSKTLYISQMPQDLDFPRRQRSWVHYTGPFHSNETREPIEFPYDRLDDRPLVYCCYGSILNGLDQIYRAAALACEDLGVQLVISLGGINSESVRETLPVSCLVVQFAPQLELLKRSALMICHGGVNSVLESLTNGVPLVITPKANDAFGSAARVAHAGAGISLPVHSISAKSFRKAIGSALSNGEYRANALRLAKAIAQSGGVKRAAELMETSVAKGQ
jgi:zeaxanthin glucosyltransferase